MKIALMGDVMLGRLVNEALEEEAPAYPWGNTLSLLDCADLRICNLECVLSDSGNPWSNPPKVFHFRSDEKNIKTLQAANIDIVSIANNHVLDYEYEAMERMTALLDRHQIFHAGAGNNLVEATKPAICEINGQKIACIAFTDNEPDWAAEFKKPGVLYAPTNIDDKRMQAILDQIELLRPEVDFLIVSAHWGGNWGYTPPKEHSLLAHALIDSGADLIFGHSCHVFRGIEIYKKCPIIYSAGDFIDDYAIDEIERNDESFIFLLDISHSHRKMYLYPTCIEQFQVNLAPIHRQKRILSQMQKLCKELGTNLENFSDHALINLMLIITVMHVF